MANIYIGADGVPIEQSDDGAFYATEKKSNDSKEFLEIINDGHPESSEDSD